jgi:hypothetical protein
MLLNGFYKILYSGATGEGFGMLALANGNITGIDEAGVKYDGEYVEDMVTGSVQFHLRASVPADAPLVLGVPPRGEPWSFAVDAHLPPNFTSGVITKIRTPYGAVDVRFSLLRTL